MEIGISQIPRGMAEKQRKCGIILPKAVIVRTSMTCSLAEYALYRCFFLALFCYHYVANKDFPLMQF